MDNLGDFMLLLAFFTRSRETFLSSHSSIQAHGQSTLYLAKSKLKGLKRFTMTHHIREKYMREATSSLYRTTITTTSGVCIKSPEGKKYVAVASHGFTSGIDRS